MNQYQVYKIISLILLSSTFVISCSNKSNESFNKIEVDVTKNSDVSTKDIYDKVEIVPLETSKLSMISNADKIIADANRYYVLDIRQKAIFVFDSLGKFKFKIQRVGRGPGEYTEIVDFIVNKYTQRLEALSPSGDLYTYTKEGDFVGTLKLPASVHAVHYFIPLSKDKLLFYSNTELKKLIFYSRSTKKIINDTHEVPQFVRSKTPLNPLGSPFYVFQNKVYYFEVFSNNIYVVNENNIDPVYAWEFGQYNLDIYKLPQDKSLAYYLDEISPNGKYVYNFMYNIENERYIFTNFIFKGKWRNLIYDKKLKQSKVFSSFTEGNSYPSLQFFDGGVFSFINPMHLNILVNAKILDAENIKKMNQIKVDDNTVIVKFHFK